MNNLICLTTSLCFGLKYHDRIPLSSVWIYLIVHFVYYYQTLLVYHRKIYFRDKSVTIAELRRYVIHQVPLVEQASNCHLTWKKGLHCGGVVNI